MANAIRSREPSNPKRYGRKISRTAGDSFLRQGAGALLRTFPADARRGKSNRQMLSTGNVAVNDRVCLFLMDYPKRTRLKILGHARVGDARQHPELVAKFAAPDVQGIVERVFLISVVSFDWNCPKYIMPRYTLAGIEDLVEPLKQRVAELETQLKIKS
jgi:hypothetical protein